MPVGLSSHSTASIALPLEIAMLRLPSEGFCLTSGSFSTLAGALQPPGACGSRLITKSSCGPDFSSAALALASCLGTSLAMRVGCAASGAIVQSSPFIAAMISDARRLPERLAVGAGASPTSVASPATSIAALAGGAAGCRVGFAFTSVSSSSSSSVSASLSGRVACSIATPSEFLRCSSPTSGGSGI